MDQVLGRLFAAAGGVITRRDLLMHGCSSAWISRRVGHGDLRAVAPGVYVARHCGVLDAPVRYRVALAHGGPDAVLSHMTAATLWGLRQPVPDEAVHIQIPSRRRLVAAPGVVVHRRQRLDSVRRQGWPVTGPLDTLVDLAGTLPLERLRFVVAQPVHDRVIEAGALLTAHDVPRRSQRKWRLAVEEVQAGAWSGAEALYWRLIERSDLPLPQLNAPVDTGHGTLWVDAVWPGFSVAVEIDSREFHTRQRDFEVDRRRSNALVLAGWCLLRFTVHQLMSDPADVMRQTETALAAQAARTGERLRRSRGRHK